MEFLFWSITQKTIFILCSLRLYTHLSINPTICLLILTQPHSCPLSHFCLHICTATVSLYPLNYPFSTQPSIFQHQSASSIHLFIYLPTHLLYLSKHLAVFPPIYPSTHLSTNPPLSLHIYLSNQTYSCLSTYLLMYLPTHLSVYTPIYRSTQLTVYPPS